MDLNNELKEIALRNGISYFGVAELSAVQDVLREQGGDDVTGYPYAISLGIALIHPYDARKCERYFDSMKEKGELEVCGLCLYVCPFGRKHK
ncbi:MAG: hypothetical protein HPY66_3364 [Firmicutes bacterium]|nr:hypothetical protein [Bacillota bacterium]